MESLVGDLLPLHEGDHLEDLRHLHQVGPVVQRQLLLSILYCFLIVVYVKFDLAT